MKINRAKQIRKFLRFYKVVYGITPPFHIILDGNFIFTALKFKLDIIDRLTKLLQGEEVKLYVQQSVLDELQSVGSKVSQALEFARDHCEVIDDAQYVGETAGEKLQQFFRDLATPPTTDTTATATGTRKRIYYFVATQDNDLRDALNHIPAIPLLYLNKVTLVMEPPSSASKNQNMKLEDAKSAVNATEAEMLQKIKKEKIAREKAAVEAEIQALRLKRKASAPNPLSIKEKQEDSVKTKKRKLNLYKRAH